MEDSGGMEDGWREGEREGGRMGGEKVRGREGGFGREGGWVE